MTILAKLVSSRVTKCGKVLSRRAVCIYKGTHITGCWASKGVTFDNKVSANLLTVIMQLQSTSRGSIVLAPNEREALNAISYAMGLGIIPDPVQGDETDALRPQRRALAVNEQLVDVGPLSRPKRRAVSHRDSDYYELVGVPLGRARLRISHSATCQERLYIELQATVDRALFARERRLCAAQDPAPPDPLEAVSGLYAEACEIRDPLPSPTGRIP